MWFVFGVGAIFAAVFHIIWTVKGKDAGRFRFLSLSLTALTLCAFHCQTAVWVLHRDWSALEDVVPSTSASLLILTLISIGLNSISLFKSKNK
ncbi:MAG: hypothetical protein IJD20_06665 [Oscillospiraceae bacterium]|nr:hypothetical protein [Oscillospiraceae bacterium]